MTSCSSVPATSTANSAAVNDLAPTGKLRAAINSGNPVLAAKDPASGEARGVSVDLSRELAHRLGVSLEMVTFTAAGKVVEAVKSGAWDIAFVAIDAARASDMDYTAPYVVIEGAYLVPATERLRQQREAIEAQNRVLEVLAHRKEVLVRRLHDFLSEAQAERRAIECEFMPTS